MHPAKTENIIVTKWPQDFSRLAKVRWADPEHSTIMLDERDFAGTNSPLERLARAKSILERRKIDPLVGVDLFSVLSQLDH